MEQRVGYSLWSFPHPTMFFSNIHENRMDIGNFHYTAICNSFNLPA